MTPSSGVTLDLGTFNTPDCSFVSVAVFWVCKQAPMSQSCNFFPLESRKEIISHGINLAGPTGNREEGFSSITLEISSTGFEQHVKKQPEFGSVMFDRSGSLSSVVLPPQHCNKHFSFLHLEAPLLDRNRWEHLVIKLSGQCCTKAPSYNMLN